MKTRSILLSGVLLAATLPAFAQSTSGMQNMKSGQTMSGMKMHQNMPCMKMGKRMPMNGMPMGASAQGMRMGKNMPCANQTAQSTGVIKAIGTAKGTVTINHQPIPSIHWPAMTMTFKADPPGLLQNVKVGEKVNFTLHPDGMHSTVTAIAPGQSAGH